MKEIWEMSAAERFHRNWIHCLPSDCWIWIGSSHAKAKGRSEYGHFKVSGRRVAVHRFSYELYKGPIPEDFVIDHLCRTTLCVNPNHLEAVTAGENIRRGADFWNRPENRSWKEKAMNDRTQYMREYQAKRRSELKIKSITLEFTPEEYKSLKTKADTMNTTLTDFIKGRL